jgi:4-amino-4-deoxy-L-arabinose transferase-like glycosyltransferase
MLGLIKRIKTHHLFLFLILLLTIFLRFYNLRNSLMFQGDQGRDAIVVSRIFKDLDPVFIGPVTSIGNMYLGPFYYYFMLPFLFLTYPNPMGPVYAVAALSVLTVYLLFKITAKVFDKKTAYLATTFFALSAAVVNMSRFSWNPNIAPFFSLLMFYFTYMAWKKNSKYWILVSVCFSILIQLHYVTLLSLSGAGIVFLIQLIEKIKLKHKNFFTKERKFIVSILLAILVFILSLTPLVLFDFKHNFTNLNSFSSIFTKEKSFDLERKSERKGLAAATKFVTIDLKDRASQILFESSFSVNKINHPLLFIVSISTILYLIKKKGKLKDGEIILLAYLVPGIIGVSLYQHQVYEHYIAYLFPFVYIFYGLFFAKFKNKWLMTILFLPFFIYFVLINLQRYSFKTNGWTIDDMKRTSEEIYKRVNQNEKYNIVLISESKEYFGMNYRYFLSTNENEPVRMEDHQLAKKLFVIDEKKNGDNVLTLPIYEIVVFPNRDKVQKFEIENGPEINIVLNYN